MTRKPTPDGWTRTVIEIDGGFDFRDVPVFVRTLSPAEIEALQTAIRLGDGKQQRAIVDDAVVFVNGTDRDDYGRKAVAARLSALLPRSNSQ